ncbi:MAG TPA: 30S ribosomal protein S6 [Planctomycetota bacterium]|nr:30S ribosomal protein S6 [Planctomycetota bacterium]
MTLQRTRTYECMCLLDNREVRKGWQSLKEALTGLFTKHGAKILSSRRWEERRLAYAIKGQQRGTYLLVYFSADTQSVAAVRRDLAFNESLLRYLILECEEVPQAAYEPEAAFDINAIPADDAPAATEAAVSASVDDGDATQPSNEA